MWTVTVALGVSLLSLSLPFGLAYLTYVDASVRSSDHPVLWGLLGLFVPVVGTVGYRIARRRLGEPTQPVPRRARWASRAVRAISVGIAALVVVFLAWVTLLSSLYFTDAALRATASISLAYGLVYWLAPTWPKETTRPSHERDGVRESEPEIARDWNESSHEGATRGDRLDRDARSKREDPPRRASPARRDSSARRSDPSRQDSPSLSWRGWLGLLGGIGACWFLMTRSTVLFAPLDSALLRLFLAVVVLLAFATLLGLAARPYFSRAFPDARPAAERVRSEYADLCRDCGVPVNGVWIAENLKGNADLAEIAGVLLGNRHLFLDEEFFEEYNSRERLAVVAQQAALADDYYRIVTATFVYLAILLYYGFLVVVIELSGGASPFPDWPLVPEVLLVALYALGVWHSRRTTYRADRVAADETSVNAVVAALEARDEERGNSRLARVRTWLRAGAWDTPSPRKRVERLADGSRSRLDGTASAVASAVEDSSAQKR